MAAIVETGIRRPQDSGLGTWNYRLPSTVCSPTSPSPMPSAFLACILLALTWPSWSAAQSPARDSTTRTERLAGLGRVWGFAKYFHPALGYRRDIDWDAALVTAIPKVREAQSTAEYGAAIQ